MTTEGSRSVGQLFRYGVVGVVSNLIAYLIFLSLTHFGVEVKLSMTLVYLGAATFSFFGNKKWTFAQDGHWLSSGGRYVIAHVMGYLINFILLMIFVDHIGYPHEWVQAAAIFVVAVFLFITFKFIVFAETETTEPGSRGSSDEHAQR